MSIILRQCLKILKNEVTCTSHVSGLGRSFCYKSAYSLENLYPKSSLKLYTPQFVPVNSSAKFNGYIPINKLDITYSASSGPGGQNVNCVNTKVDVRFNVKNADWLCDEAKNKLLEQQKAKINKDGYLIVKSDLTRSQQLNLANALEKIRAMIRQSLEVPAEPTPETQEMIRKRQLKAARQRVFVKRARSLVKQRRNEGDFNP